jgi:ArsR family transcriptional regulator
MHRLTNVFKILSDETRLRILVLLYKEELCVCELCGILKASQPKVSKNLSKLRDLGLVEDERQEKFVFYTLRKENKVLTDTLENILKNQDDYPQIAKDLSNLSNKKIYLNKCCPPGE